MRKMFGIPMVLALFAVPASVVPTEAGVSVGFSIEARSGYVPFYELEDEMNWDDMMIVDNNRIGVWVMGPAGQMVFRCRNMWYDNSCDEWRYGPWWYDYYLSYNSFNGIRFHIFMNQHYPRYHERYFYRNNGFYFRYNHRYDNRHYNGGVHGYRHNGSNAPSMERNGPVVHREKQRVQTVNPVRERTQTTVIVRETARPVRTDGGDRVNRTTRSSGERSVTVVRGRSASSTRVQPSSNATRVTGTETRRQIQKR